MGEVSSAVDAIVAAVAELQAAAVDELSHREIVAELARLTAVAWTLPAVEHRRAEIFREGIVNGS